MTPSRSATDITTDSRPPVRRWLWIFGEIEGLRWVLERNTMAFADHARGRAERMHPGDEAILYVTRGAFHNPTRDEARLAGIVTVASVTRAARKALAIAGRQFTYLVDFAPQRILPEREGPAVRPLVSSLSFVKRPEVWGHYFRNTPIELSKNDFQLLRTAIRRWKPRA